MPWSRHLAIACATCMFASCASNPSPKSPPRPPSRRTSTSIDDIDSLLATPSGDDRTRARQQCLAAIDRQRLCAHSDLPARRTLMVRVALDRRYLQWPEPWDRLARTVACVNRFYEPTGIAWDLSNIEPWNPDPYRHQLYPLLTRLRREMPADTKTLRLGITVWEPRRIYAKAGGEIGLSQGDACVVPSWPRVENDCLILAHELGHLIGAVHVPGKHWIMGWSASPFHLPAQDPLERVAAVYRFHPRNVAAIAAHRTARLTGGGLRPTPACIQRIARIDACYGL